MKLRTRWYGEKGQKREERIKLDSFE